MPIATKICRVCGKEYEACHTNRVKAGSFRWQDVSCSPECGEIYLRRILESRGELPKEENSPAEIEENNANSAENIISENTESAENNPVENTGSTAAKRTFSGKKKKSRK